VNDRRGCARLPVRAGSAPNLASCWSRELEVEPVALGSTDNDHPLVNMPAHPIGHHHRVPFGRLAVATCERPSTMVSEFERPAVPRDRFVPLQGSD